MSERLLQFGPSQRLSGVVNDVKGAQAGLVLFNAGVVHRVGAHRLNVKLARAFAGRGAPSLRFDLSGQGESPAAPAGLNFEDQAVADLRAAVDVLQAETADKPVVLLGICSGADNSLRAALADERVAGLVLLDPYAYAHPAALAGDLLARAGDPDRWLRKARGLFARNEEAPEKTPQTPPEADVDQLRPTPPKEIFGRDLETLAARGVKILIVYTGFVRRLIAKPAQFFEIFSDCDFRDRVNVVMMTHTDHTYTQLAAQAELIGHATSWLDEQFGLAQDCAAS